MPNIFWYLCLSVVGLGSGIYTVYKKRKVYKVSTLLIFYLFTACLAWIGEFIVLGLFNSYAYKIGIFKDIWEQNLLGHLILNTSLYPTSAVIMAAYSYKYKWIAFIAALFTSIEYVCVKLRIYEQHWWRYYMTFIAVIAFLLFDHKWFKKMNEKRYGITRAITFYFVAMIIIHIPAPVLLLLHRQSYKIGFVQKIFGDEYLASIIVIFFYHLIESLVLVIFTCVLKKWYWKIVPFVFSISSQCTFAALGILSFKDSWNLIYTLIIYETFIGIFILTEKFTLKPDTNSH